jgi:hypothetical protein
VISGERSTPTARMAIESASEDASTRAIDDLT